TFSRAEPLRVVVSAGAGHRKELLISQNELAQASASPTPANAPDTSGPADRSTRISLKDVLMGIGFVLALAAFFLSWRNARHIRPLQEKNSHYPLVRGGRWGFRSQFLYWKNFLQRHLPLAQSDADHGHVALVIDPDDPADLVEAWHMDRVIRLQVGTGLP